MDLAAAKKYYDIYKKIKSYQDAYGRVKSLWDDDTRDGAIFNELLKFTIGAAGRILGKNLSEHPYFAFHKAHLEILTKALNAQSVSDRAEADWTNAAAAAVQTTEVANRCQSYKVRRDGLIFAWGLGLSEGLRILSNYHRDPAKGNADLALTGGTAQDLQANMDSQMLIYRGLWCELAGDALSLLLMTDSQCKATEKAIASYREKVAKLKKGNIFDQLFGHAAEEREQWRQLDGMTATGPDRAVTEAEGDPLGVARRAAAMIDQVARQVSRCTDLIMSEEPYTNPQDIVAQLQRPF